MKWLQRCTVAQLQSIARSIGSNTGGKKAILSSRLLVELQQDRFALPSRNKRSQQDQHRIVSIDMGIRNLALCTVVVPRNWQSKRNPTVHPVVQNWARVAISKKERFESSDTNVKSAAKEAFDPPTYAQHAYDLVSNYILPLEPTQILIERQRFRSLGGSAVQEWTLRVNMFEAMIYATLKTLSERKLWQGSVHPVAPAKVSKFWLGDEDVGSQKASASKTKSAKVALVGNWLADGERFQLQGEAADVAQAYRIKLARPKARQVVVEHNNTGERDRVPLEVGKLDDLADCLLQAMAWIMWEDNRRALVSDDPVPEGIDIHHSARDREASQLAKSN